LHLCNFDDHGSQISAAGKLAYTAILVGSLRLVVLVVVLLHLLRQMIVMLHLLGHVVVRMLCDWLYDIGLRNMAVTAHRLHGDRSSQHVAAE